MTSTIRLVIFDLGGTLFHEIGPWEELFRRADRTLWKELQDAGVPIEARAAYGTSANLFEHYYALHRADLNEPTTAAVLDSLLQSRGYRLGKDRLRAALGAMFAVTQTNWQAEQDALPTLDLLRSRGYRIAAISNASDDDNTQALIDKGGLRSYLEFIVSSAAFGKRKPHSGIFRAVLEQFQTPPANAVMVGDDYEADIVGAQGVGMRSIWITRRVAEPVPIRPEGRPVAVVSALSEIPPLLESM
jgi:HAD superfamily hydrolase (TIGR01509 family)